MTLRSRSIFVGVLILCFCVCTTVQAKPITLSYNTNALNVILPILVAQALGFFTAEKFFAADPQMNAVGRR